MLSARKVKTILREQDVKEEMMPLEKLWPFLSHKKRKYMLKFFAPTIPKVKEFIDKMISKDLIKLSDLIILDFDLQIERFMISFSSKALLNNLILQSDVIHNSNSIPSFIHLTEHTKYC